MCRELLCTTSYALLLSQAMQSYIRLAHSLLIYMPDFNCCAIMSRQLALRFHPDKACGPGQKDAAEKLFRLISHAHHTLSDQEQRRLYDLDMMRRELQARARSPRFR